eukprot:TRINITY_DN17269_c0_g1_i1.p1 TRINITY_DN17269_c0_g1~~TRINITY_DN17269_c0_g1_i1.p1  ORF type:complete len:402 (+),score=82.20 TRINITY_DN17269_c0_g1_i1:63-1268(+)
MCIRDSLPPAIECVLSLGFPPDQPSQGERWALNTLRQCCFAADTPGNQQARAMLSALGVTEVEISSAITEELSRALGSDGLLQNPDLLLETALHLWERNTPQVTQLIQPLCAHPPAALVGKILSHRSTGSVYQALSADAKSTLWQSSLDIWCMELAGLVELAEDTQPDQAELVTQRMLAAMRGAPHLCVHAINELVSLLLTTGSAGVLVAGQGIVRGVLAQRRLVGALPTTAFFPAKLRSLASHLARLPLRSALPEVVAVVEQHGSEGHALVLFFEDWSALVSSAWFASDRPVGIAGLQMLAWLAWPRNTVLDRQHWAETAYEHTSTYAQNTGSETPEAFYARFMELVQRLQLGGHALATKWLLMGGGELHEGGQRVLEELDRMNERDCESPSKKHKGSPD